MSEAHDCLICGNKTKFVDSIVFDTTHVTHQPPKDRFAYFCCETCGFVFAPDFQSWTSDDFGKYIYCDKYNLNDPKFGEGRALEIVEELKVLFTDPKNIKHLDYGGGDGSLSRHLRLNGWDSTAFDPFYGEQRTVEPGQFNLITAVEVLEHALDPLACLRDMLRFAGPNPLLFITTQLVDAHITPQTKSIDWFYANPRAGHVCLQSRKSLSLLAQKLGLKVINLNSGRHILYRTKPDFPLVLSQVSYIRYLRDNIRVLLKKGHKKERAIDRTTKYLQVKEYHRLK